MSIWIRFTVAAMVLGVTSAAVASDDPRLYQASYDLESIQDYAGALGKMDQIGGEQQGYVYHLRRGWLLYLLGRHGDSAAAYRAAVEAAPDSLEARQGLVLPLMAMKRWLDAEAVCVELLSAAPTDYRGNSRLAFILYSMGRYGAAADRYEVVLTLYPSDVEMRAGLGWSLLKQGKTAEARSAFEAVLQVAPSHVSAREGLDAVASL
ncbi:MAG: hypothetical protein CL927_12345 [Deltaproteobacteria bacterium]|nr:hypothetical protein [Deltaproteobacteria bacterium]